MVELKHLLPGKEVPYHGGGGGVRVPGSQLGVTQCGAMSFPLRDRNLDLSVKQAGDGVCQGPAGQLSPAAQSS